MPLCFSSSKSVVDHDDKKKVSLGSSSLSKVDAITGTTSSSIVVANWKCNETRETIEKFLSRLNDHLVVHKVQCVIAAPSLYLPLIQNKLTHPKYVVAAANAVSSSGPITGEISFSMLQDFNINWVLLGHSDRRVNFNESNEVIAAKVINALKQKFVVIVCVGETTEERERGKTMEVLTAELECIAEGVKAAAADAGSWQSKEEIKLKKTAQQVEEDLWDMIVIAYEPAWASVPGSVATPEEVQEVHQGIRSWVTKAVNPEVGEDIRILYGGVVTKQNAVNLYDQPDVNGFLINGTSWTVDFLELVEVTKKRKTKVYIDAPFSPQRRRKRRSSVSKVGETTT